MERSIERRTHPPLIQCLADCLEREAREVEEVARMIAERTGVSMEAAEGMVLNVLQQGAGGLWECLEELNSLLEGGGGQMAGNGKFLDLTTSWEWKEARARTEQVNASRFRQRKSKESAWAAQKRTGQRKREWHGPWRDAKRRN